MEELNDLNDSVVRELTDELEELSINTMVLARGARGGARLEPNVLYADMDESDEMLKGRLATLLHTGKALSQLNGELQRLRQLQQPLNQHFTDFSEEMHMASRLQRDFLPRELPDVAGVHFATIFRPVSGVSGDIYDIMRLDETHSGFYVADAVGHGMPAALLTMFIKRALVTKQIEEHSYRIIDPGESLGQLNDDLVGQNLSNYQFVTCCYGVIDTETLRLRMASGGHPPPLYIDAQAQVGELDVSGRLLGVFEDQEYVTSEFQLRRGDKLLLFSDGVEVAFENNGPDEPLRFPTEFGDVASYDVETMCAKLVEIIDRREGSLHPRDDVTIVALELRELS